MAKSVIAVRSGRERSIPLLGAIAAGLVGMSLVWSVPQEVGEVFIDTDRETVALITTLAPGYQPWAKA